MCQCIKCEVTKPNSKSIDLATLFISLKNSFHGALSKSTSHTWEILRTVCFFLSNFKVLALA